MATFSPMVLKKKDLDDIVSSILENKENAKKPSFEDNMDSAKKIETVEKVSLKKVKQAKSLKKAKDEVKKTNVDKEDVEKDDELISVNIVDKRPEESEDLKEDQNICGNKRERETEEKLSETELPQKKQKIE